MQSSGRPLRLSAAASRKRLSLQQRLARLSPPFSGGAANGPTLYCARRAASPRCLVLRATQRAGTGLGRTPSRLRRGRPVSASPPRLNQPLVPRAAHLIHGTSLVAHEHEGESLGGGWARSAGERRARAFSMLKGFKAPKLTKREREPQACSMCLVGAACSCLSATGVSVRVPRGVLVRLTTAKRPGAASRNLPRAPRMPGDLAPALEGLAAARSARQVGRDAASHGRAAREQ